MILAQVTRWSAIALDALEFIASAGGGGGFPL
jgi:hypothetical protein